VRDRTIFMPLVVGALGALASLAGCANLPAISSRAIGCPQEQIVISNESLHINNSSWTATCRGWPYFCQGADNFATCTPSGGPWNAPIPQPPAAATPAPRP
jgi:hypothetical protein